MKLTILKNNLINGISSVERISQKNISLPILETVLFETYKNFLKLSTTNLESGINWYNLAKIEKQGKICIPVKFLATFLNLLPEKPILLEVKNSSLELKCGSYNTKIKGNDPKDFPIIPEVKEGDFMSISSPILCQSLNKILNIPSPSVARPEISGILFIIQKDLLKLVATDSFRLAETKINLEKELEKEYSLILPQPAAREVVNIFGEKEGNLKIYLSPNQIFFEYMMETLEHPQIQFTSRLIEGEYPNYQEIIPKKYTTHLVLPKEEFLKQIKTAGLFSGKINEVKIKIRPKEGKVEIFSQNPDLGEYNSFLKGKIEGKEMEISFNHRFLTDGISKIRSKEVIFDLTNEEGPAILKPTDTQDYFYIIMPIKTV